MGRIDRRSVLQAIGVMMGTAGQVRDASYRLRTFGLSYDRVDSFGETIGLARGEVVDGKHGREDYVRFPTPLGKQHTDLVDRLDRLAQAIDDLAMALDEQARVPQEAHVTAPE